MPLAAPTFFVAVLQTIAQLAETWLAARQGTVALAGWAVVMPFGLLLMQMSGGAIGGGVVSAIARALGAGRKDEASALVAHGLLLALGGALLFMVVMLGFARPILTLVGGPEAAAASTAYAMCLFGFGALPAWFANTLASVLRGGGQHAFAAAALSSAWIMQPLVAWFLMERVGLGLPGAGIAYAVAMLGAGIVMAMLVLRGYAGFVPTLRLKLSGDLFRRILSVGLIASVMAALGNLATMLVTSQVAHYGTVAVAAYGVIARLEFLTVPLAFGVGSALTALVGNAVGAGDWPLARRTAGFGAVMAFLLTGLAGLVLTFYPERVAALFASDLQVAAVASRGLQIVGPAFAGLGVGVSLYFAAMGAGRMGWPFVAAISRIVLAVGGGYVLSHTLGYGLDGQFYGVALGLLGYGFFNAIAVRPGVWSARVR
ncbi:multidrug efflux protein [Variibacter gotjawalensis]|uniref:Multidrug efflux protein n=2 Tax=Variibacter gotjawalensis TaxID=1333996 RepID=A0A0S3PQR0_9BRAD|nr:putative MATE family efflux protein [Variibacter gotjawalensis]BAT58266.1 multidrug efflux protein [Variibacter gotjawalensis]